MSMWTVITLVSCVVILMIVTYLTLRCTYHSGPFRTVGFFAMAIGCIAPIFEVCEGVDYDILPSTAVLTGGTAIFMVSHWLSFEMKSRRKREGEHGDESKKRLAETNRKRFE